MKKGKLLMSLLLAALLSVGSIPIQSFAEENGGEQAAEEETETAESETEHPAAYYEEIQTNQIAGWPQGEAVDADAAIVMDAETGAILYAKNIDRQEYPASITKIMTTLVALENGNLSDVVTFSENAVYSIEYGSSHLGLTAGEELTLEQCLYGIMLASANEISNAVAEHIGGSIENYVQMMNDKVAELGCTNTHFVNVHGLHDDNHYVCAKDMALIMQAALKNEKFREIISTVEYHYPKTNLVDEERYFINHHKMISEEGMLYDGCIGGKTGYTDEAGNTLVTAAERDGQELICVVLKCTGLYNAYEDTEVLLDYAFENFQNVEVPNKVEDGTDITGITDEAELEKIRSSCTEGMPSGQFSVVGTTKVTLPDGQDASALTRTIDFTAGTITYTWREQTLGSVAFSYNGQWETEAPTEAPTEAETQTETLTEATEEASFLGAVQNVFGGIGNGCRYIYGKMDDFIKENTVVATVIGAVLLLIFIPLLLVAINRHRKYLHMMELREQELEARRQLEAEIEAKSAAQVEAELRAAELEAQLEEEKKRRRQETPTGGQEADMEQAGQPLAASETKAQKEEKPQERSVPVGEMFSEEEYIEVPIEDGEPLDGKEPSEK